MSQKTDDAICADARCKHQSVQGWTLYPTAWVSRGGPARAVDHSVTTGLDVDTGLLT